MTLVIELVNDLKKQRARPNRESAAQIVVRAKQRAKDINHLPREALMKQFSETVDAIRAEAIAKGTAIEGELESD